MTTCSAFISHNIIMANSSAIETLMLESQAIDQNIDNAWQGINRLERDGNVAMLMVMDKKGNVDSEALLTEIKRYITQLITREGNSKQTRHIKELLADNSTNSAIIFQAIMEFIVETRKDTINSINIKYLEKLSLQEQIETLKQHNSSYANLALFFQVMGLILVLSKDLARRTWPS